MIKLNCTQGNFKRVIDISEYSVKEVRDFATTMANSGYEIKLKRIVK